MTSECLVGRGPRSRHRPLTPPRNGLASSTFPGPRNAWSRRTPGSGLRRRPPPHHHSGGPMTEQGSPAAPRPHARHLRVWRPKAAADPQEPGVAPHDADTQVSRVAACALGLAYARREDVEGLQELVAIAEADEQVLTAARHRLVVVDVRRRRHTPACGRAALHRHRPSRPSADLTPVRLAEELAQAPPGRAPRDTAAHPLPHASLLDGLDVAEDPRDLVQHAAAAGGPRGG